MSVAVKSIRLAKQAEKGELYPSLKTKRHETDLLTEYPPQKTEYPPNPLSEVRSCVKVEVDVVGSRP